MALQEYDQRFHKIDKLTRIANSQYKYVSMDCSLEDVGEQCYDLARHYAEDDGELDFLEAKIRELVLEQL